MSTPEPFDATADDVIEAPAAAGSVARPHAVSLERLRALAPAALIVSGLAVALLAQFLITDLAGTIPNPGYGFLIACALFGTGFYLLHRRRAGAVAAGPEAVYALPFRVEVALVIAVMALATFFRFWRFVEFPPGVWYDEAVTSTDALYIMDVDHWTVWRETNFGRSTLFLYMLIASFKMFGYTVFAMRFVPAVAGVAAVLAFYFLARSLLGPVPALVATALLAVSRWAVTFSRISWEASLQPLFEILAVYFFIRAVDARGRVSYAFWALAGASLALGIYTYLAFRFVPFVMAFFLAYVAATRWRLLWSHRTGILVYALAFLIVIAPLANFAYHNQDKFLERTRAVNVFKEVDERESYAPLRDNVRKVAQMMNVAGDHNGRHNLPFAPMVDEVTGALLVLGMAGALLSWRSWRYGTLPIWLVVMVLPSVFTISIENPSAIRSIGAIPPLFLLAGVAVAAAYGSLGRTRAGLLSFGAMAAALVGGSVAINYYDTFERQAKSELVYDAFTPTFSNAAEIVSERAGESRVLIPREYAGHPAFQVIARGKTFEPYDPAADVVFPADGRDVVLIVDENQLAIIPHLQRIYPDLVREDFVDRFGRLYFSELTVPASDIAAMQGLALSVRRPDGTTEGLGLADVNRAWTAEDLAGGPLVATWRGYVWSAGGEHTFSIEGPGDQFRVEVDGELLTEGPSASRVLGPGEHDISISARISGPGRVNLRYSTESAAGEMAAGQVLYARPVAGDYGFEVLFHRGSEFSGDLVMRGELPFAVPAEDPARESFAIEYRGVIQAETAGEYGFAVVSSSSAQLFVDGELLVDNGGAHSSLRKEETIALDAGPHEISVQYTVTSWADWSIEMRLPGEEGWRLLDGREFAIPTEPYRPPAIVRVAVDQTLAAGLQIPGFPSPSAIAALPGGGAVVASERKVGILDDAGALVSSFEPDVATISDLATTEDGRIVLVDTETKRMLLLSRDGQELGRVEGAFATATGVDVQGDRAIVTSPSGGHIYEVSLTSGDVRTLPTSAGEVRPRQPSDTAIAPDGSLYIADFEGRSIVHWSPDGRAEAFRGAGGTGVQIPHLTVTDDLVIVTEPTADRILLYDRDGKQRGVFVFPPRHGGTRPVGIDVDERGRIWIAGLNDIIYRLEVEIPPDTRAELDAIP
ncbi:MAG TPA: glycosyltransferase family 39 protein [Dehalococcoidia bacterium]|nr:glycosyltransferase family 39 protein [Dehalococcoidia bacterium]